jgi:large subunit ribosomal protein L15
MLAFTEYVAGRRIINLQATIALLHSPIATQTQTLSAADGKDQLDREPFRHPALEGLANLTNTPISVILTKQRLAQLGTQAGLREVLRWKPKMVCHTLQDEDTTPD